MKKLIVTFFILVFFSSVFFAQAAEMSNSAAKLYNEGIRSFKSGDYLGAIKNFDDGLNIEKHYKLYFYKGQALRKNKEYANAIENYKLAKQLNPDYYQASFYMASTQFSLKNYEKAKLLFEETKTKTKNKKVIKSCEKNINNCNEKLAHGFLVKADEQKLAKNYGAAIENYKLYLEKANNDQAYIGLAEVYIEQGNYEEGLKAADNSINYRAKKSKVPKGASYFLKGLAFKGLNDFAKAKENFEKSSKDKLFKDRSLYEIKYLK